LIGLGLSVPGDIYGDVIVVRTFAELDFLGDKVKGKIVCYNQEWKGYGYSVQYRSGGASKAAKYGAIGVLVRSVASVSVYSPHTVIIKYS
jgi:carboxypeptidase Q